MTDLDVLALWTSRGQDRDTARAMLAQARLGHPIDDIQMQHLLHIGYRAGRAYTGDGRAFGRTAGCTGGRWLRPARSSVRSCWASWG